MNWRVYVSGQERDVSRVSELIEGGHLALDASDPSAPYLHGAAFDEALDASDALTIGRAVLPRLNAAGRLDSSQFTPLELTSRVHDGTTTHVFAEADLFAEGRLTVGGDPGPGVTSRALETALADD